MFPIRLISSPSLSFERNQLQNQSWGKWIIEKIQNIWKAFCDLICCRCYRKKTSAVSAISIKPTSSKNAAILLSENTKPKTSVVLEQTSDKKPELRPQESTIAKTSPKKTPLLDTKPEAESKEDLSSKRSLASIDLLDDELLVFAKSPENEQTKPAQETIAATSLKKAPLLDTKLASESQEDLSIKLPLRKFELLEDELWEFDESPENERAQPAEETIASPESKKPTPLDSEPEVKSKDDQLKASLKHALTPMERFSSDVFSHLLSFMDKKSQRLCLISSKELLRNLYHAFMAKKDKYSPLEAREFISLIAAFKKEGLKLKKDKVSHIDLQDRIDFRYTIKKANGKDMYELSGGSSQDAKKVNQLLFDKNIKLIKEGRFPNLEVLILDQKRKVDPKDFHELLCQIPKIKVLRADTKHPFITNELILEIAKKCPELQILDLNGGTLSKEALFQACKTGFKNLDSLKLRSSDWVTYDVIKEIFQRLPNLDWIFVQTKNFRGADAESLKKEGIIQRYSDSCMMNGYYLHRTK